VSCVSNNVNSTHRTIAEPVFQFTECPQQAGFVDANTQGSNLMRRLFTMMTMFAISAAMVGCAQDDIQAQKPSSDTESVVTSGDDDSADPVNHSAAKPVVPDEESTESTESAEEPAASEEPETEVGDNLGEAKADE
jgi:hypothetical protein